MYILESKLLTGDKQRVFYARFIKVYIYIYIFFFLKKIRKYLKQGGVNSAVVNGRGDTPIHAFVRREDHAQSLDCLFTLFIYGEYDIDILNAEADTPLHLACKVNCGFI